jgi:hypothetical protein
VVDGRGTTSADTDRFCGRNDAPRALACLHRYPIAFKRGAGAQVAHGAAPAGPPSEQTGCVTTCAPTLWHGAGKHPGSEP